jgi:hypothetical protein
MAAVTLWFARDYSALNPAEDCSRSAFKWTVNSGAELIAVSSQLLRRVGAVQVRPLGARQNAELDDAR